MSIGTGLLAMVGGGMLAAGFWEARAHRRALESIPLRIHVNGTRGKSSTTAAITTLLRELGKTVVGKTTGTVPVVIEADGTERLIQRRGRTRVQEQVRLLRYAARQNADAVVIECMAVDPTLQWICEHRVVRSHIGVITNVRRDHFEEMGRTLEDIARCLANTIPRDGVLVTADARFAPLFAEVAAPLGTHVVLVDEDEVQQAAARLRRRDDAASTSEVAGEAGAHGVLRALDDALLGMHAENVAVACRVAVLAGFSEDEVRHAARVLARPRLHVTALGERAEVAHEPGKTEPAFARVRIRPANVDAGRMSGNVDAGRISANADWWRIPANGGRFLVHAWSMNDIDSFGRLLDAALAGGDPSTVIALYNHRSDRPLRAMAFGRLFAATPGVVRVLVTGDPGGERLLRRAGVPAARLATVSSPLTVGAVEAAVEEFVVKEFVVKEFVVKEFVVKEFVVEEFVGAGVASEPLIVFGCGNARGVEALEVGGELPAAAGSWV